jgi:hypothetical protein
MHHEVKVNRDLVVKFPGSRAEDPKEGGGRILRNVDPYLPDYTIITFQKTVVIFLVIFERTSNPNRK